MAGISAGDVKALRDSTGAGMMDCKKALKEADGDVEKALELLRASGLSKVGKRAGRETSEGAVVFSVSGGEAALIELGCETDFVARTPDFKGLAHDLAMQVAAMAPTYIDIDDVPWKDELVTNLPAIDSGEMKIPTGPGWGTDLNEEVVKKHLWKDKKANW